MIKETDMTTAYFAGRKAYHYGLATTNNPHRYYTAEYRDWADGWQDGEYEADQEYTRQYEMTLHEEDC
jgi:hypothetical protein